MGSFRRVVLMVMGVTLGAGIGGFPYLNKIKAIEQRAQITINNQFIIADVARTEGERQKGLGGKEGLKINDGMLFIFDEPGRYGFWMRGVRFPIDIIWIKGDRVVGVQERMPPVLEGLNDSEIPVYYPPEEVDRVLEIASGRVRLLRARVGDTIQIKSFVPKVE